MFRPTDSTKASPISLPLIPFAPDLIRSVIPSPVLNALRACSATSPHSFSERSLTIFFSTTSAHSLRRDLAKSSVHSFTASFSRNLKAVLPATFKPAQAAVFAPIHAGAAAHPVKIVAAANATSTQAC